jgi:hypothetical protein
VATFADLTLSAAGAGYTLVATATGLTPDTSAAFDVLGPTGQVFWTNAAGGNWSAGANWSTGTPPGPTDTALITLDGTYAVTLDVNATVAALTLGGASGQQSLSATSRTLTIAGASTVGANGRLVLDDAGVAGVGFLTNEGAVEVAPGPSTIGSGFANAATGTLTLLGNNGGDADGGGGVDERGETAITGGFGSTLAVTSGTLVNANRAVLRSSSQAAGHTLAAVLDNQGTLEVQGTNPLTLNRADAAHLNSGTIAVTGGDLTLTQTGTTPSVTSTGAITVGTGRTLSVSGGTFTNAGAGLLQGDGTLAVATTTFSNAALVGPGLSPGILTVTGNYPQTGSGALTIELGGTTVGTQYDRLAASAPRRSAAP